MNPQTSTNKVLYDYFCSKKNKIKWTGSLEDLKAFVLTEINEETAERTKWRSPSGGTWVFDSEPLFVTWHSKSKNIGFDGERGKDLTERIHSYLQTKNDTGLESANAVQSDQENGVETLVADDINELTISFPE